MFSCPIYLSLVLTSNCAGHELRIEFFQKLLAMVPNLLECVIESEAELVALAESVCAYLCKHDLI